MIQNLISLQEAVNNFKELIESAILQGGVEGKHSMIRSSRPILNIHEAVKSKLIKAGVERESIFPPLNARTPELYLAGSRKQKKQDICIVPNQNKIVEKLQEGFLQDVIDDFGERFTERTISINVRSQISSIQKNFDTLHERTTSEAINLHDRCPKMCLGEVYMIAIPEYDDQAIKVKTINFKNIRQTLVLKYIKSFQAINNRKLTEKNFYQYERVCLLIVDFSKDIPKIYNTDAELVADGLIPPDSTLTIENMNWESFFPSILSTYKARFGT